MWRRGDYSYPCWDQVAFIEDKDKVFVRGFFLEILFHGSTSCSHWISRIEDIYHHIRRVDDLLYDQYFFLSKTIVLVPYTTHSRSVYFGLLTRLLLEPVESSRHPFRRQALVLASFRRKILVSKRLHRRGRRAMSFHSALVVFELL